MSTLTVYEIGEDSDRWVVVGDHAVHRETISVAEARLAVIEQLRVQLLPSDAEGFAEAVATALTVSARTYEYPIYGDDDIERIFVQSPVGKGTRRGERLGSCAVAFGFYLLNHHQIEVLAADIALKRAGGVRS